jgi:hypothetical protein
MSSILYPGGEIGSHDLRHGALPASSATMIFVDEFLITVARLRGIAVEVSHVANPSERDCS